MKIHRTTYKHRVTFSDCDPAHMAYYPRILEWFDHSTDQLFRSVGLQWEKMFKAGEPAGMPLLDISVQFKSPCRFGDELVITTWIDAFEGRRFTVKHELQNGDVLGATCREHRAWVMIDAASPKGIRAVPVPEHVRRLFHHP